MQTQHSKCNGLLFRHLELKLRHRIKENRNYQLKYSKKKQNYSVIEILISNMRKSTEKQNVKHYIIELILTNAFGIN